MPINKGNSEMTISVSLLKRLNYMEFSEAYLSKLSRMGYKALKFEFEIGEKN